MDSPLLENLTSQIDVQAPYAFSPAPVKFVAMQRGDSDVRAIRNSLGDDK
jgi:hypothetical protein